MKKSVKIISLILITFLFALAFNYLGAIESDSINLFDDFPKHLISSTLIVLASVYITKYFEKEKEKEKHESQDIK